MGVNASPAGVEVVEGGVLGELDGVGSAAVHCLVGGRVEVKVDDTLGGGE